MNVTDGILRVRYRDSWEEPRPLRPVKVAAITVEAFPTANLFKRGHRIRLARNTVYVDVDRPSHVVLPITKG